MFDTPGAVNPRETDSTKQERRENKGHGRERMGREQAHDAEEEDVPSEQSGASYRVGFGRVTEEANIQILVGTLLWSCFEGEGEGDDAPRTGPV